MKHRELMSKIHSIQTWTNLKVKRLVHPTNKIQVQKIRRPYILKGLKGHIKYQNVCILFEF